MPKALVPQRRPLFLKLVWSKKINLAAFAMAAWRLFAWTLGFLALISLIAWLSPDETGSPTVPGWAKPIVWAQFVVPVLPAVSAGVARLRGNKKWPPIFLGAVFGLMGPFVGIAGLAAVFVPIGFNLELKFPDDRVPDLVIFVALFSVAVVLGVATALWRAKRIRKH
jgi:nitrate/nitrite transporter NarK